MSADSLCSFRHLMFVLLYSINATFVKSIDQKKCFNFYKNVKPPDDVIHLCIYKLCILDAILIGLMIKPKYYRFNFRLDFESYSEFSKCSSLEYVSSCIFSSCRLALASKASFIRQTKVCKEELQNPS